VALALGGKVTRDSLVSHQWDISSIEWIGRSFYLETNSQFWGNYEDNCWYQFRLYRHDL